MTVAEVVLCGSRVPVSFIKHPFIFGLSIRQGLVIVASSKCTQNWRLAARAIIAVAVSRLHAFGREGMPPFSRNETLESQLDSLPGGQDYKPAQMYFVDISFDSAAGQKFSPAGLARFARFTSSRFAGPCILVGWPI